MLKSKWNTTNNLEAIVKEAFEKFSLYLKQGGIQRNHWGKQISVILVTAQETNEQCKILKNLKFTLNEIKTYLLLVSKSFHQSQIWMSVYLLQWGFIISLNFRNYGYHDFLFSSQYLRYDAKKIIWIIVSFLIALFRAIDIWTSMNLWPSTLAATNTSCTTCSNKTIFQKWNCIWRSSTRFSINAYSIVNFWLSYLVFTYLSSYARSTVKI